MIRKIFSVIKIKMNTNRRVLFVLLVTICVCFVLFQYRGTLGYLSDEHLRNSISNIQENNGISIDTNPGKRRATHLQKLGHVSVIEGNKTKLRRYPKCIIFGTRKSGTRALLKYLTLHPKLSVSEFEQHFFSNDSNYEKGLDYYRRQMPLSYPDQITIEKTPNYFNSENATKRIHEFNPKIKLIVALRHPVLRLVSDYEHYKRHHADPIPYGSLMDLVLDRTTGEVNTTYKPVDVSMYYVYVKRWLDYFPQSQIHVVDGENLIVNPVQELEKIERFLGIKKVITNKRVYFDKSKGFYCIAGRGCLGDSKGHKFPPLDPSLYRKLMKFFDPYNKHLFKLLNRTFIWE